MNRIAGTIMIIFQGHIVLLKVFLRRHNVKHCHHSLFHHILMRLHIQNRMWYSVFSKQKIVTQKTRDHYCPELILLLDLLVIIFLIITFLKLFISGRKSFPNSSDILSRKKGMCKQTFVLLQQRQSTIISYDCRMYVWFNVPTSRLANNWYR